MFDVYLLSIEEGNSFNRIAGIFGCKNPKDKDFDRVLSVFRKVGEYTKLAYSNGTPIEEKHLEKVMEQV